MLQVRAEHACAALLCGKRNTCNGEKSQRLISRKVVYDEIFFRAFLFFLRAFA